jgi:ABC-type multidrug transport system fused ATPase/permease subunit
MFVTLRKILAMLDRETFSQAVLVIVLILVGAAVEAVGIGLLFPFIQLVIKPDSLADMDWLARAVGPVQPGDEGSVTVSLALFLLALFVAKNLFLMWSYYVQARYVQENEARLAKKLLDFYLNANFLSLARRNSAELIRNLSVSVQLAFANVFMGYVILATELCVVAALCVILVIADPLMTLGAIATLGTAIALFHQTSKHHFTRWGDEMVSFNGDLLRVLQQGLHSFKELKVLGVESSVRADFAIPRDGIARMMTLRTALSNAPRLWIETVTVVCVLGVVLFNLGTGSEGTRAIALLALFAAVAMRLTPSMNRILIALSTIRTGTPAVEELTRDIEIFANEQAPVEDSAGAAFTFSDRIELKDVSLRYHDSNEAALSGITLTIRKGESIGLVGPSGAGKSSLVDVILGLVRPTSGSLTVDGRDVWTVPTAWRSQIGYVPQSIYLADDTVRANLSFGRKDHHNEDRLREILRLAQLEEVVEDLPKGLDTRIGEHGARLSGGQRQRVGIARALYNDPEILMLDEATSALDTTAEAEFARAVNRLHGTKTLLIVAHRLSTIRSCDRIVLLDRGRIVDIGDFTTLSAKNDQFRRMVEASAL